VIGCLSLLQLFGAQYRITFDEAYSPAHDQDGDTEKSFLFDVSLFERVAQIVKPRKRRLLTETQLQALLKNQRRFEAGAKKSSLKRAQTPQADNLITQGVGEAR
jgi:hypothetical protein